VAAELDEESETERSDMDWRVMCRYTDEGRFQSDGGKVSVYHMEYRKRLAPSDSRRSFVAAASVRRMNASTFAYIF